MIKIGLLSDTHGDVNEKIFSFFENCDEIWHCGDIGALEVIDKLLAFKPLRAVYGNIDGAEIRNLYPKFNSFQLENVSVLMTHIGGYPKKYDPETRKQIISLQPKLYVCGHSHILKVMYDDDHKLLHINPGAAGKYGFHLVSTLVRFSINGNQIENFEILEMKKN